MTYLTIVDLIKTDKDLFSIFRGIDKASLYDKLKSQVLDRMGRKKYLAEQDGKLDVAQSTIDMMEDVDYRWDAITNKFEEYLFFLLTMIAEREMS